MANKSTPNLQGNKVENRLNRKDRIEQLKLHIRELGIWNLPTYRELGAKYGISLQQIHKDIKQIISTFDPRALEEVFTEFFNADKKAMRELRKIMHIGTDEEKMKAIDTMLRLQKGTTELLEAYAKKQKVADKLDIQTRNYTFTTNEPVVMEIVPQKKKDKKKEEKEEDYIEV